MSQNFDATDATEICWLSQHYLKIIYAAGKHDVTLMQQDIEKTYGEILPSSIDKLISIIKPNATDIFYDFGSGLGKVVLQFFLTTAIKEAHGIEVLPALHAKALHAAELTKKNFPEFFQDARKLNFILSDFRHYPVHDASILLCASPCFSPNTMLAIGELIEATQSIHTVLSLRPILNLCRLVFYKAVKIHGSWDSTLCYIYRAKAGDL